MGELRDILHVDPSYQPILRMVGLDAEAVFEHPDIHVWRRLPDRENATLDADLPEGKHLRLHVKRYPAMRGRRTPAEVEAGGIRLLQAAGVPTVPLVAWGRLADGRSFILLEDLAGYAPADKQIESGVSFERLLAPTVALAAKLHDASLHHRDLYLCHFFVKLAPDAAELRLIDAARVRRLPRFWPGRWIVKDLAQFWYSAMRAGVDEALRRRWLEQYAQSRGIGNVRRLERGVVRKAACIARHDARLQRRQPGRNVSIPET